MRHKFTLKSVPIWSVTKVSFVILLIVGIVIGFFYAIMLSSWSMLFDSFSVTQMGTELGVLRKLGFVMIPFLAIFYAIFGTISTIILALIYNLIASAIGGIEMVLEETGKNIEPRAADTGERTVHIPEGAVDGF